MRGAVGPQWDSAVIFRCPDSCLEAWIIRQSQQSGRGRMRPDFGVVEGPFQMASIEYAGSLNGEATYELSLQSAGALIFTPDLIV